MSIFSDNSRRRLCSFVVLLFALQVLLPALSAGQGGTMQCCRRVHGRKTCCPQTSKETGPAFHAAGGCSGDCAAVVPTFSPLADGFGVTSHFARQNSSVDVLVDSFARSAFPPSSNSFQRPPPVL